MSGTSGEAPGLRRGMKPNRPKPATPKKIPSVDLSDINLMRKLQEEDDIISKILKLKVENAEKPTWEEISSRSREFKFYVADWELSKLKIICFVDFGMNWEMSQGGRYVRLKLR